jgi:GNAT superfamily N-acetyltransferase
MSSERVDAPDGLPELVVEDSPAAPEVALLEERVAAAASAAAALEQEREFAIFAYGDDGGVVAGIAALVWGGHCELEAMWVDESLRHRGLARALMAGAEAEARRRGCRVITLHAYDLLVRGFYERLGYETVGVVDNCVAGSAARWFCKFL